MFCSLLVIVSLVFRCYDWRNHIYVIIAICDDFHFWKFECLKTIVSGLHHSCRRHSWEAVLVEKVRSHFSDTCFSWEHSSPEWTWPEGTHMVSRVVGRESLLVDWFEYCKCLFRGTSQNISSTRAVISEPGLETLSETTFDIHDNSLKPNWTRHRAKHFYAGRGSILIKIISLTNCHCFWWQSIVIGCLGLVSLCLTSLNINLIQFAELGQVRSQP